MKVTRYIKGMAVIVAAVIGIVLPSCEDEPDKYEVADGLPTVLYVRMTDPELSDSLITGAYLSNTVCLVGYNLRSIYEMYFNDKQAVLNTSVMTDNTVIVDVPSTIPDVVTNKIYMVTKSKDTVTYDFEVLVSSPSITSMTCEYASPGETVTIYGNYFIDDPNVPLSIEIGDVPVTEINDITQTTVTFVIPDDVSEDPAFINVTSVYGTGQSTFRYRETEGLLFDFDDDGDDAMYSYCGWHSSTIGTVSNADPIDNNYLIFQGYMYDYNWNDTDFIFEYWPYGDDDTPFLNTLVDFSDLSSLQLKFEANVPDAWSASALQIILTTNNETYGDNMSNAFISDTSYPRALWIPWQSDGSYTTDGWVTVTVNLSDFKYNPDGEGVTALSSSDITGLTLFVYGGGVTGTECNPTICIDNIRIVTSY